MSDIELKPCPYCQSERVFINNSPEQKDGLRDYYAICYNCSMAGPEVSNEEGEGIAEEQAAAAWNALPRRLQWTKEPPQNADYDIWLWRECPYDDSPQPYTVYWAAQVVKGKVEKILVAQADLEDDRVRRVSRMGGEWAGPIPKPQEQP